MRLILSALLVLSSFTVLSQENLNGSAAQEDKPDPLKVTQYTVVPGLQTLHLPASAFVVSAGMKYQRISVFAAYSSNDKDLAPFRIWVVGNNEDFPFDSSMRFINTVMEGQKVWHVFSDN